MAESNEIINAQSATRRSAGMFWIVVVFFAFEYLRPQSLVPAIASLHVPLVLSVILGLYWLATGNKNILRDPLIALFIGFIAMTAISVVFAVNTFLPYKNTLALGSFLFTVVLPFIAIMDNEQRLRRFVTLWVMFHAGLSVLAIVGGGMGSGSFVEDENDLCLALDMAVPYAWFLATGSGCKLYQRLFYYGIFALLIVGIIATDSRGGFIGLVAALGLIVLQGKRPVRKLIVIFLVGTIVVYAFVPKSYFGEIESISNTADSTRQDRFYLWTRAVEMFEENPVLGIGSGNFPMRVSEYELRSGDFDPDTMHLRGGRVAHSLYFTLLSEYGTAGVLIYGSLVTILVRRLGRIIRDAKARPRTFENTDATVGLARAMLQALVAFLAAGAFISVLVYPHLWYLVGFVIALDLAARQSERNQGDTGDAVQEATPA